ncbi:uncharacterized protein LOC131949069 [Physella acuta]|uniref:uncharacterized protein LOC131949069 n=1 Tax=Physella acuta TaxID=109671 RepID=UPI0027DE04BB|nr:uncharacterized protein LOC131949069 [Physella acuta]
MVMVFTPTLILDVFHPLEVAKMGVVYVFPVDDVFYTVYMATPFFNVAAGVTIYYCDPNNTAALAKTLKAGYPQFYSLTSYRISAITLPKDNLDKPRKSSCRIEFNNQAAVFLAGSMRTAKGELRYPAEAILPVDLYATSWKSENLDNYASPSTYYMVSGSFGNVVKYVKSRESESQHELQEGDVLKVAIKGENYENLYVEISESTPTFLFLQYGGLTHISNAAWSNVFSLNLLFPFVSRRLQGTLGVIHYFSAFPEITSGYILKMDQVSLTSYKNVRVPAGKINVLLEANIKFGCVVFGKSNGSLVYYNSGLSPNSVFQDFDLKLLKPKQKNFIFRYVCPNQKYGINCLLNCECPDYHCNMNGTCYSSNCKIGTFGPKCQHADLSIFSTAALLNQYFDHDDSSCKQANSSIAISFPNNFYVYTIHLVLQNALDPDSLVQAVYVENAATRQMVKVNYVTEVQESKEHTVVIWLDEVHWTRVIRIYLNSVSVCTVNIDGGVNLASQEHMLFTSKEFDKQQLDCLKDGDRYATCLTLEDNKKVEVELALRVTIRRLTVYSYDNRKQWLLQVTLLDKVKATQKKIVKESDEEVFITIDVVQEVTNIQLEAIQGTLSICEVEIYTDMWAPRSTTTTGWLMVGMYLWLVDGVNVLGVG